jgi:DNA-binding response OmpR family regulator
LRLRPIVYSLSEFLMRHLDQLFSAEALLERVWLDKAMVFTNTVRVHFRLLRKSLRLKEGELIRNVRNRCYILEAS